MKKLLNKKGFTLMEMLIVVAIIVILVAISIPTFTTSLDDAKEATDAANLRSAKAVAVIEVANGGSVDGLVYDIDDGKFVAAGSSSITASDKGQSSANKNKVITGDASGKVEWK